MREAELKVFREAIPYLEIHTNFANPKLRQRKVDLSQNIVLGLSTQGKPPMLLQSKMLVYWFWRCVIVG